MGAGGGAAAAAEGAATHTSPTADGAHAPSPEYHSAADPAGSTTQRATIDSPSEGGADKVSVAAPEMCGQEVVKMGRGAPRDAPLGARGAAGISAREAHPSARERQENGDGNVLGVGEPVAVVEAVSEAVMDGVRVGVTLVVAEGVPVRLSVALGVKEGDGVRVGVALRVAEGVSVRLSVALGVKEGEGVMEALVTAIIRMRLFDASATKTVPVESTATPRGALNAALAAGPSVKEAVPLPANVATNPMGEIFRIRLLRTSAM